MWIIIFRDSEVDGDFVDYANGPMIVTINNHENPRVFGSEDEASAWATEHYSDFPSCTWRVFKVEVNE